MPSLYVLLPHYCTERLKCLKNERICESSSEKFAFFKKMLYLCTVKEIRKFLWL